jgi:hypothetical protein
VGIAVRITAPMARISNTTASECKTSFKGMPKR